MAGVASGLLDEVQQHPPQREVPPVAQRLNLDPPTECVGNDHFSRAVDSVVGRGRSAGLACRWCPLWSWLRSEGLVVRSSRGWVVRRRG